VTVVTGFVGPECAVMASDTEATEADGTQREIEKIWASHELLFGYSGSHAVREPLKLSIDSLFAGHSGKSLTRWEAKELLQRATGPVLKNAYGHFVPGQPGETYAKLGGAMLVIGIDDDGYWLLEIDADNTATFYTDRGFHTVGSGAIAAQMARGLLEHYEPEGRRVHHLRLLAFRTIATCIRVLGGRFGVGGSPRVWSSEDRAAFAQLGPDELAALEADVGGWVLIEKESLDTAFPGSDEEAEEESDEDLPPPLTSPDESG
jgi:20S proteasome alpha/beta subunit